MSGQKEITISGVGGQGLILCGKLIAEAAVCHDGKKATLSSEYGVETRGTFAKSDVIVSSEDIYFPEATEPDLIVCLHQIAYERYAGSANEKTLLMYDSSQVTPRSENARFEKGFDILGTARSLGNAATANIITMGFVAGCTGAVSREGAHAALADFFGKKGARVVELNQKAFDTGMELAASLR